MKINLYCKGLSDSKTLKGLIEQWAQDHVAPLLPGKGMGGDHLEAVVTHHVRGRDKYSVKLRLHLPRKRILVAGDKGMELKSTLAHAEDRLLRMIHRHFEHLRGQHEYKRKARRLRLRELKALIAELPADVSSQAKAGIEPLLPQLERVVRRELVYLRYSGILTSDYPTVQDVVDEAVAAVTAKWRVNDSSDKLLHRLLREAFIILDHEIEASRRYGELRSLEENLEKDADDQAEAMVEEEFYEYYQPDEVLQLSDVLPDETVGLPENALEADQQIFSLVTLGELPIQWRRVLMLTRFEQLAATDVATILKVELDRVEKWREQAEAFLRDHLQQVGFSDSNNNLVDRPDKQS